MLLKYNRKMHFSSATSNAIAWHLKKPNSPLFSTISPLVALKKGGGVKSSKNDVKDGLSFEAFYRDFKGVSGSKWQAWCAWLSLGWREKEAALNALAKRTKPSKRTAEDFLKQFHQREKVDGKRN
jgi:hypothetical protein